MAVFDLSNAAGQGFNMSDTNGVGWAFVTAPNLTETLVYDDGSMAIWNVSGSSVIDQFGINYWTNGYDVVIYDAAYFNNGAYVLTIDEVNLHTTFADLQANAWFVRLNAGDDTFYGNDYVDFIRGGYGWDALYGYAGNDTLYGDAGNDWLQGGGGNDAMYGGTGDDIFVVEDALDFVGEAAGEGHDKVLTSLNSYTLGANVEDLTFFGIGNFTGIGNDLANVIKGDVGNDWLDGKAGADTLVGLSGNDTYVVDSASDVVIEVAGEGTDTVRSLVSYALAAEIENLTLTGTAAINGTGNALGNIIIGNTAANVIAGRGGADTLDGGGGIDTASYAGSSAGVEVSLALGMGFDGDAEGDTLVNFENLTGSVFDDVLEGNGGNNTLVGGAGFDMVWYGNATAGVTVNLALVATAQNTIGAGTDTLSGFENVAGSAFNDTLTGDAAGNFLFGNGGNDTLNGGAGADQMQGGLGNDIYVVDNAGDVVDETGGDGTDRVQSSVSFDLSGPSAIGDIENLTLTGIAAINGTGNALDNIIIGNSAANLLVGNAGNDTLDGGAGADTMRGGLGNDIYVVDNAGDGVDETGGDGTDLVKSSASLDLSAAKAIGSIENLTLTGAAAINGTGNALDNIIIGNSAANVIAGLGGADTLDGGGGIDTASYAASLLGVNVSLALGSGMGGDAEGDTLVNFENLTGSSFDDTLAGDALANTINGGLGNDTISGRGGNDLLNGGSSTAALPGGNDTVDYAYLVAGQNLTLALGALTVATGAVAQTTTSGIAGDVDTIANFENITGGAGNDTLIGNAGVNILQGGDGDDRIQGGAGADILSGGNNTAAGDTVSYGASVNGVVVDLSLTTAQVSVGSDAHGDVLSGFENIIGSALADSLTGDDGNNILTGGAGKDTLTGGFGDDILIGGAGADTLNGTDGSDTASYATSAAGVTVNLNLATAQVGTGDALGDVLSNIDNITGSALADTLIGDGNANVIDGGLGADLIDGGAGADTLSGGGGIDTLTYLRSQAGITVDLALLTAQATVGGDADGDILSGFENLTGSGFDDILAGDALANTINGGLGNDTIMGRGGNDVLNGGSSTAALPGGNDTVDYAYLVAGQNLTLALGALTVATGAVAQTTTSGIAGDVDTIANFENITGGAGNDTLIGNAGVNILQGGDGDDRIQGGAGADILSGGNNTAAGDTVSYGASVNGVVVDLSLATAQVSVGSDAHGDVLSGFENIIGSALADSLTGDDGNNILTGGAGKDTLTGGFGDDILIGGAGADTLNGTDGSDTASYATSAAGVTVNLNLATAQVGTGDALGDVLSNIDNITGSALADTLIGDGNANVIDGGLGADLIDGGAGADTLSGGGGIDTLTYLRSQAGITVDLALLTAQATVGGDADGDILSGFENLTGSGFDDILAGDALANTINGGLGNDTIMGRGGNDVLNGGSSTAALPGGNDTVDYAYLVAGQNLTLALGALTVATGAVAQTTTSGIAGDVDTIANFENITGGAGNDTLIGNAGVNILQGGDGDDRIQGGAGADILSGGNNTAAGDTVSYGASVNGVVVDLSLATAQVSVGSDAHGDVLSGFENIIGSALADSLTGDDGNNILTGGAGKDTLTGGLGDDILIGGAGADTLNGTDGSDTASYATSAAGVTVNLNLATAQVGTGDALGDVLSNIDNITGSALADTLIGDGNANVLTGGLGIDKLTGGGGSDTFDFKSIAEGKDTITDFETGTDLISISRSGFGISSGVALGTDDANDFADHYFVSATAGPAATEAGHGQFLFNQTTGQLFWDDDGTGSHTATAVATLTNAHALGAQDFWLV